jgi:hypothetical protein
VFAFLSITNVLNLVQVRFKVAKLEKTEEKQGEELRAKCC